MQILGGSLSGNCEVSSLWGFFFARFYSDFPLEQDLLIVSSRENYKLILNGHNMDLHTVKSERVEEES